MIINFEKNSLLELKPLQRINTTISVPATSNIGKGVICGEGRCKSCKCKGYKPKKGIFSDSYCANCGHAWSQHE